MQIFMGKEACNPPKLYVGSTNQFRLNNDMI